ncbi:lysozyme C-like [Fundulus heteroclitus]|uniref:lysozyme C-like n=1 Tax=Fundulus heteroclitus TaxID=8078 RepID=UPI00165B5234|nr:lysozyme C-like [Fundulus heteroclitus]
MMKHLLLLLLVAVANAKIYERCDWAKTLKAKNMDGYRGVSLADGVCLTQHGSNFNTGAINRNTDDSTDYGIFQINNKWWCSDGGVSRANGCGIRCSELQTDNVETAIRCAKRIVDQQGVRAWVAWKAHCQNRNLSSYLRGCNL